MRNEHLCEHCEIKDHEEYLELIDAVRPATAYIAIIQIDGYNANDPGVFFQCK